MKKCEHFSTTFKHTLYPKFKVEICNDCKEVVGSYDANINEYEE